MAEAIHLCLVAAYLPVMLYALPDLFHIVHHFLSTSKSETKSTAVGRRIRGSLGRDNNKEMPIMSSGHLDFVIHRISHQVVCLYAWRFRSVEAAQRCFLFHLSARETSCREERQIRHF